MRLYLVRHGQSGGNVGADIGPDPPLTELGRKQAALAGERLSGEGIEALHCSPLRRALQTATIIGERLGLDPVIWVELCEKWGGTGAEPGLTPSVWVELYQKWAGAGDERRWPSRSEIQAAFPNALFPDGMPEVGWWRLTGETEDDAYLRAGVVEARLRRLYEATDKRVLVVTHGTFGGILISRILGAPPCGYTRFSQNNCCISTIEIEPGRAKLSRLNATDHLPPDALT